MSGHHHNAGIPGRTETPLSQSNISPASRDHAAAEAALKANTEAVTTLKEQRAQLLEDEATARRALDNGAVSEKILEAISTNIAKAAALVPAIESLEADRPALVRAVDRATGEIWAERVRAAAPTGTYGAVQAVRDELATEIREAVDAARAKAEAVATEHGALLDEAARLHRAGLLPQGASYSSSTGLTFDGAAIGYTSTADLAEKVGRALDSEAGQARRAAAYARAAAA